MGGGVVSVEVFVEVFFEEVVGEDLSEFGEVDFRWYGEGVLLQFGFEGIEGFVGVVVGDFGHGGGDERCICEGTIEEVGDF